jgi:hypothetical protein
MIGGNMQKWEYASLEINTPGAGVMKINGEAVPPKSKSFEVKNIQVC